MTVNSSGQTDNKRLLLHFRQMKGKLYISLDGFALKDFAAPQKELKQEDYLLGVEEAKDKSYGDIVGLYSLDFGRIVEIMNSFSRASGKKQGMKKSFIMAQARAILQNYDDLIGVSRQNGRWVRSWMRLNLKEQ
jgi:hypothetical protein